MFFLSFYFPLFTPIVHESHGLANNTVTMFISGMQVSIASPQFLAQEGQSVPPTQTVPAPIPLSDVRLVYPLSTPTPDGGTKVKDTIISALDIAPNGHRYIANYISPDTGKPFRIPFPTPEKPEFQDYENDTLRLAVEEGTWVPSLIREPMPGSVIDELRNKYSKHRTRHEASYVEFVETRERRKREMQGLEEKEGGPNMDLRMMTPAMEFRWRERMEKKKESERRDKEGISEEVMVEIGKVMKKNGVKLPVAQPKEAVEAEEMEDRHGEEEEAVRYTDAEVAEGRSRSYPDVSSPSHPNSSGETRASRDPNQ